MKRSMTVGAIYLTGAMELGIIESVTPTHTQPMTEDDQVVMIEFQGWDVGGLEE